MASRPGGENNNMSASPVALELTNIHKTFGQVEVLKGIDLTAHEHDVISIIGSSGSGKSTFLRCINLLENPTEGDIRIRGEQLALKRGSHGDLEAADQKQLTLMRHHRVHVHHPGACPAGGLYRSVLQRRPALRGRQGQVL